MDYIVREIAKSMDLDPDKLTNSLADAAVQAELLRQMNPQQPTPQQQQEEQEATATAGVDAKDPTGAGGGTIGTGQVPLPNEQGFTGNEQAINEPSQAIGQQPSTMAGLQ